MFLKKISLILLCAILILCFPLDVAASDTTTETTSSSSSGEYVTVDVPLTWTLNKHINFDTGEEYSNALTGSVTGYINIIPAASYSVSISGSGAGYNSGVMAFYYENDNFLNWQELWNMSSGGKTVALVIPSVANRFRLTSDMLIDADGSQNILNLSITVSATYLEEHDLTEETLIDVVYKDENHAISDAADAFESEYEILHETENYLLDESTNAFDEFFASFSFSDLIEYSSGFQFIGTWFSNFYNAHSALAVCVGMSAGLTILFILLRFRGH